MNRRLLSLLPALAIVAGCGGGGGSTATPIVLPTVQPVRLDDRQRASLEPLADGLVWVYGCSSGAAPRITAATFGSVAGADTYLVTTPLPVGRSSSAAGSSVYGNDENGNLSYFGFTQGGAFTAVLPATRIEDANPADGAVYRTADRNGGTVVSEYQGKTPLVVPAGSYDAAYRFRVTYSKNQSAYADFYDVRGVGTVRIDYSNGSTNDSCSLQGVNIAP